MSKRVLCLLTDGFEEIETVTPIDILRRAGAEVTIAALHEKIATGRCGIRIESEVFLKDTDPSAFDLLLIPGGPGVEDLRRDGRPAVLAQEFFATGKPVAAICAAPLVLMDAGLLKGKRFTAYHSVRPDLGEGCVEEPVVVDGLITTSRGAGTALDFSLSLVATLFGRTKADDVAKEIMA